MDPRSSGVSGQQTLVLDYNHLKSDDSLSAITEVICKRCNKSDSWSRGLRPVSREETVLKRLHHSN